MKYLYLVGLFALLTGAANASLTLGCTAPGLEGYTIDNSPDYLGPLLDVQDILDAGKVLVAVHWKKS